MTSSSGMEELANRRRREQAAEIIAAAEQRRRRAITDEHLLDQEVLRIASRRAAREHATVKRDRED